MYDNAAGDNKISSELRASVIANSVASKRPIDEVFAYVSDPGKFPPGTRLSRPYIRLPRHERPRLDVRDGAACGAVTPRPRDRRQ
jgi:hypothetical protein